MAEIVVESLSVDKPILITSFPGIGLVATIATAHFITELNLELIGIIGSESLPPVASLFEGIVLPPVRIYESRDYSFILIHSDVPVPPAFAYEFSKDIVSWAININAKKVCSLAGVATFEDKKRVFGAVTQKELLSEIEKYVEIFKTGTISGIAGTILNECVAKKIPGIALLGETNGFNPDPRAAASLIEAMNKIFNWKINIERLIKEAEFIETQMQKLAEQARVQERREVLPMFG
ncbi:MAG: proteasome assembly chaperone family protein [Archaeoglobaceae archaeon]|nr:proteasome assembly chaperone family protein [Archaeoglobaceae archaeon]MCX8152697.1 proteasome assembly chaperone family protein [Archaeoglobaceae archaeon]MDW8013263.1 proteasome assembly chaperone family protein [Archaeoglobaceae archaeon]